MNRQGAKMIKRYVRCLHCGELRSVENCLEGEKYGELERGTERECRVIVFGFCDACLYKILNTGRKNFIKNEWSQVVLKNQLDN